MSDRLNRGQAEGLLKALHTLLKAQGLYPPGHSALQRAREALDEQLFVFASWSEPLLLGLADGFLVLGGCAFTDGIAQAQELVRRMEARKIEGVLLEPGITAVEVGRFLEWLRAPEQQEEWKSARITLADLSRSTGSWDKAARWHGAAVRAVEQADRDVREGRIPDPQKARECVAAFSELLDENPQVLSGLLLIKDYDNYTFHHSVNVSLLSLGIGRQLGLGAEELECLGVGGLFHDIGKTRTPVDVVRKPGRLTPEEYALIKWHPAHGRDILSQMSGLPEPLARVVYEHHMWYDGGGYPERGNASPLHPLTPLVTTADVYDAMTTHRPYRPPMPLPAAVQAMLELRGTHLSPEIFDTFVSLMGPVPVGSLLRLASGEVAVATQIDEERRISEVLVVAGADGRDLPEDRRVHRQVRPDEVAGWVGGLSRNVDVVEAVKQRI